MSREEMFSVLTLNLREGALAQMAMLQTCRGSWDLAKALWLQSVDDFARASKAMGFDVERIQHVVNVARNDYCLPLAFDVQITP